MKRNLNRPFWNLASLLGVRLYLGLPPPPQDFWFTDVPSTVFLPPGRRWWQHPRSLSHAACILSASLLKTISCLLEDAICPSSHLHLTLMRFQDILNNRRERSILSYGLVNAEAEEYPKWPLKLPSAPTTWEPILPLGIKWELHGLGPGKQDWEFY